MSDLLRLLSDGRFHSGESLGRSLGVTRSAVWKQLQQMEERYAIALHKVQGRGYKLSSPLSLLDEARLRQACAVPLDVLDSVDSTNAEALRCLSVSGEVAPRLFVAEQQSAGRGRRGRHWHSPYGENLYLSLLFPVEHSLMLDGLSLCVGLAVQCALVEMGFVDARLKWPNDVLVGDAKIAGVLLELVGDPADRCHVVIGVGVNVNMLQDENRIDQDWTSMRRIQGGLLDRTEVLLVLIDQLLRQLDVIAETGFAGIRQRWEQAHAWQGRRVRLSAGNQAVDGVVLGVDGRGALRLQCDEGERCFSGGELSLRLSDDS